MIYYNWSIFNRVNILVTILTNLNSSFISRFFFYLQFDIYSFIWNHFTFKIFSISVPTSSFIHIRTTFVNIKTSSQSSFILFFFIFIFTLLNLKIGRSPWSVKYVESHYLFFPYCLRSHMNTLQPKTPFL